MKIFIRIVLVTLGIIFLAVIILALDIFTYPREELKEKADAAIVLGAAIWQDEPSPVFRERLNHAVNLYKKREVNKVILTGGVGEGETFSEAEIAEKYLIQNGVSNSDILKETASRTTLQNLENSLPLVSQNNIWTVLIVSDPLHLRRAVLMAKDLGLEAYPSATPTTRYQGFFAQLNFLVREIYFYLVYLLLGK